MPISSRRSAALLFAGICALVVGCANAGEDKTGVDDTGTTADESGGGTDSAAETGTDSGAETGTDTGAETGDSAAALPQLEILLQNLDLEDRAISSSGQDARGHLIQTASYLTGHDIVIFTHLEDGQSAGGLFGALGVEYPHRTNVVGCVCIRLVHQRELRFGRRPVRRRRRDVRLRPR